MSDKRITRAQAKEDLNLLKEIETFNPFSTTQQIPRTPPKNPPSDLSLHNSKSEISSGSSTDFDTTILQNNTNSPSLIAFEEGTNNPIYHSTPNRNLHLEFSSFEESTIQIDNFVNNTTIPNLIMNANPNMALPTNQTVSLADALKIVPEFDGSNISVTEFLRGCSEAKNMIGAAAEGNLIKLIRTKIFGEAKETILGQDFNTLEDLGNFIKDIYSTTKTVKQLYGELGNEYQKENENVLTFANRIRDIGSRILEAQRLSVGEITQAFKTETQNDIIECFKDGLLPEIERKITEQENINNLIREAIKIEKKILVQNSRRQSNNEIKNYKRRDTYTAFPLTNDEPKQMF